MKSSHETCDVVIIGAGIVGTSIALALSRRGLKTINIDSLPASGYGSTSHSSAIVRPMYSHVTSCAIAHEARSRWQNWGGFLRIEDERGFAAYTECGGLILLREGEEHLYEPSLKAMTTVGVKYRILNAEALEELYPGISLDSYGPPKRIHDESFGVPTGGRVSGGIFVAAAGYVSDPQLATHNLQIASEFEGARFFFNAKVVEIMIKAGAAVGVRLDNTQDIAADIVINAAGPHSGIINEMAGIRDQLKITTRPMRHEVAYLPADAKHFTSKSGFLIDQDAGIYLRPDGVDMLIGSTDPDCDPFDEVDPDNFNAEFTEQWTLQAYRAAQRFPEMGISNTARGTVGLYDVSDDWIPIYDKSDLPGFYLAVGTSGNQFKNAPIIGDIMLAIVERGLGGRDHDAEPATLELTHTGRVVSLDFYSRNREIQATHSVMA